MQAKRECVLKVVSKSKKVKHEQALSKPIPKLNFEFFMTIYNRLEFLKTRYCIIKLIIIYE